MDQTMIVYESVTYPYLPDLSTRNRRAFHNCTTRRPIEMRRTTKLRAHKPFKVDCFETGFHVARFSLVQSHNAIVLTFKDFVYSQKAYIGG